MKTYFKFDPSGSKHAAARAVPMRCPHCRREGIFHGVTNVADLQFVDYARGDYTYAGVRICPNDQCRGVVFVVLEDGKKSFTAPPEIIDFDSSNLPPEILSSFEEAILAHSAGAYRASALMVRRTLEELCVERGAVGGDLKKRLQSLGSIAVIPTDLLDAADELRLLGNDAAHVEAKQYDDIGPEEAALAIELAKELLKAVYQYASLVGRLRALKKPAP